MDRIPGGEGSLIGGGGSVVGLGSDIAGSLRVPSHFCGISTIKPTARRVAMKGIVAPFPPLVGGEDLRDYIEIKFNLCINLKYGK